MGLGQAVNSIFLGRQSLRFAFEITPRLAGMAQNMSLTAALAPSAVLRTQLPLPSLVPARTGDLPPAVSAASIVWEKGSLVSYTEPATVNSERTAVFEGVVMRQVGGRGAPVWALWACRRAAVHGTWCSVFVCLCLR